MPSTSPDGSTVLDQREEATVVTAGADKSHRPLNKKEMARTARCRTRKAMKHMLGCVQHIMLEEEFYEDLSSVGLL